MKGHPTLLIIDVDSILMAAAFASQSVYQWDDETVSTKGDLKRAKEILHDQLDKYKDAVGDKDAVPLMCLSCPSRRYFRHDVYEPYKSARVSSTPPIGLPALREYVSGTFETRWRERLEADDVVGILATQKLPPFASLAGADRVVVSVDKDLQQIPGLHLNATRPGEGVYRITPERAERFMWEQVLTGDPVDNYPGLKGVGPVKAAKILDAHPPEYHEEAVRVAYDEAGMSREYMASQVNCARILQAKHYINKEIKLWK